MANDIAIIIDDKEINRGLKKLLDRGTDMAPVMQKISAVMLSSVQKNFQEEGRPEKWTPLAAATIKQRRKIGKWPGMILQRSQAGLLPSIQAENDNEAARVGTNKIYGAVQHFGGMAGRGRQVRIPARPYMVVQDEDLQTIKDLIEAYLTK